MKFWQTFKEFSVMIIITAVMTGCATSRHYNSSVVDYLYPDQTEPIESPTVPHLSLPLRVGVAFVPDNPGRINGYSQMMLASTNTVTEKDKFALMQEVSDHFKSYEFVKSIELIPSAYLRPKGGFANLNQIRTMHDVDVIVLLSYDQSQFVDEGFSTISYWTILGAYMVKGEKNDTHTMVDAAVYHIPSRKMLFRAPGISHIKSKATPINLSEQTRLDSLSGFHEASTDLILKLDEQLQLFRERVKESPEEFKVVHKPGYTGGGTLDIIFVSLVLFIGFFYSWNRKREIV